MIGQACFGGGIGRKSKSSFPVDSAFPWSSYWANKNLNLWVKQNSRNGLTLTDSLNAANSPTILPCYFKQNTLNDIASSPATTDLDIGTSDFTWVTWIKPENADASKNITGRPIGANLSGTYLIYCGADNKYHAFTKTSGTSVDIGSAAVLKSDNSWHCHILEINQSANTVKYFIDKVQQGLTTAFTGTFGSAATAFKFGYGILDTVMSYSDTYIFNRLLLDSEKTTIQNRGFVAGARAYWPGLSAKGYIYDASGNNYHLTMAFNNETSREGFSIYGSRYGLDYGYRLYKTYSGDEYVPLKSDGTGIASIHTGAVLNSTHIGNLLNHNLSNSNLLFVGDEWDRNSTVYFDDQARLTEFGYLSGSTKEWHIELINNYLFQSWGKINHKAHIFCGIDDYSYKSRSVLKELITSVDDLASEYNRIINNYFRESAFIATYEDDYLYWQECTDSVVAINGNKQVKYNSALDTIYLSNDNGLTWSSSIAVPGSNTILQFAYIFDNGNILIGTLTKLYISLDSLATINEVVPKDIAGNNFTPATQDNYLLIQKPAQGIVGTKTVICWVNYTVNAASEFININVWYTTDSGATVKSAYLANTTLTPVAALTARHGHGITFNPNDDSFWLYTGDGTDQCNIIQGVFNDVADTWAWTKLYGDNDGGSGAASNNTFYKLTGINFIGTDVYWASDSDLTARRGIYKCVYADFNNTANYVKIFPLFNPSGYTFIDDNKSISIELKGSASRLITSNGLVNYIKTKIYNIIPNATFGGLLYVIGKDSDGWLYVVILGTTEILKDYLNGSVLKVKIK